MLKVDVTDVILECLFLILSIFHAFFSDFYY